MKAKIGLQVHIFSPDKEEDWGLGEIIDVGHPSFGSTYPTIKTDDGKIIGGIDCWWFPIGEKE